MRGVLRIPPSFMQLRVVTVQVLIILSVTQAMSTSSLLSRGARGIEKEYTSVLSRLFKPVKGPSRHSGAPLSTEELFQARKKKFAELYSQTSISRTCKVIHVAGTKGKGSTVEYIATSLQESNRKTGVFTSPHMHTARERIRIGHSMISHEDMIRHGEEAIQFLSSCPWVVFFDLLLAASLKYFDEQRVDYMVLESGIGGRYDSTNFIDAPAACVITSISLDHQQLLGDTVEEIAWQKAGIIKPHAHVFTPASQKPSVLQVFRDQCALMQATLHVVPVDRNALAGQELPCDTEVQVENACLSQAVLNFLDVPPTGWDKFFWPCRMERFAYNGNTVVLDGCHNGNSVEKFLKGLRGMYPGKQLLVLFGAGHEKCLKDMMSVLLEEADEVMMVQSTHFRAMTERELLDLVPAEKGSVIHALQRVRVGAKSSAEGAAEGKVHAAVSLGERLQYAVEQDGKDGRIIAVCGSLFAAAEGREHLFSKDPSLFSETDWVRERDPVIPM